MLAIVDGTVMPAAEATVPATDEGLLRGDGVFEVIRLYGGRPLALDEHVERLGRSARNLRLPLDAGAVRRDVQTLLEAAEPADGLLRVVITRGGRRIAMTEPLPAHADAIALATVTYAPTRVLDGVKSLSYAANMLATRLAWEAGADEALLVTPHGRVLEGPTSTLFCSLDGAGLVTPPLDEHILDSITRRRVIDLTGAREAPLPLADLLRAREAFLASTTREIQAVRAVDSTPLAAAPGPLTAAAQAAFAAAVAREVG
ncbi:MAG TPA: aminotransferase class IV [Solirubrobacteraceae bacterium]|nr:aminotransferase class IV [Solirubrobacteraceae bacterium]